MKNRLVLGAVCVASACAQAVAELQAVVASGPGQIRVWEICCSSLSGLTEECLWNDLSCWRLTIENGYDLTNCDVYLQANSEVEHEKPRKAWLSLPCSIWSARDDLVQRSPEQQQNFEAEAEAAPAAEAESETTVVINIIE
jgi:hypothetical protein